MTPNYLLYDKNHEWVRVENDEAYIGVTDYAQSSLGDIVYVELPEIGDDVLTGDIIGEIESTKSTSDLHTPLSGVIVETNQEVIDKPELINSEPYGFGWLFKITIKDRSELSDLFNAEKYARYSESL